MMILVPGLIFYLKEKKDDESFRLYKKINPLSVILLIVITWLLMPLVIFANAFSQLFTTNAVMNVSGQVLDYNVVLMVFIIGFFGPFTEEFVFRGIVTKEISRTNNKIKAILCGLPDGYKDLDFGQLYILRDKYPKIYRYAS